MTVNAIPTGDQARRLVANRVLLTLWVAALLGCVWLPFAAMAPKKAAPKAGAKDAASKGASAAKSKTKKTASVFLLMDLPLAPMGPNKGSIGANRGQ